MMIKLSEKQRSIIINSLEFSLQDSSFTREDEVIIEDLIDDLKGDFI